MREPAALQAALELAIRPGQARTALLHPLPSGMTLLLEVAAGHEDALAEARQLTGRGDDVLRQASGFFIEQSLLSHSDDSYRVLGGRSEDAHEALRRHMVLLMKWLHPDIAEQQRTAAEIDRSVFASRIAAAWDNLKTSDRRAAYDRQIERVRRPGGSDRIAGSAIRLGATRHAITRQNKVNSSSMGSRRWKHRARPRASKYTPLLIRVVRLFWGRG